MKSQKFKCAALLSTLALGMVSTTAFAAEDALDLTGNATIQYEKNTEGITPVDPESPDKPVIVLPGEGTDNKDKEGELRVDFVSHLKFGTKKITTAASDYYAAPTNVMQDGTAIQRGNYVQVTDQRSEGTPKGWKLSAQVTKPFTNATNSILKGAQITFDLPYVNSSQEASQYPTANSFTLDTTGSSATSQPVASAEAEKGWGTYTIEYGRPELGDGTASTMDKAVKLSVPANTPLDSTSGYQAEITWTIGNL